MITPTDNPIGVPGREPGLVVPRPGESAALLNARLDARAAEVVGEAVDASLDKARELREEREQIEAERREAERQREQREAFERLEREDALRLADRRRAEAQAAERRDRIEGDRDAEWAARLLRAEADRLEAGALDVSG